MQISNNKYKDGRTKHVLYRKFRSIINRCCYKSNKQYKDYGGRGIKCEWEDFSDFIKDMELDFYNHKKNNTTTELDRIDNNGNYSRENCRWVTHKENSNNKRNNHLLLYKNEEYNIESFSKKIGLSYSLTSHIIRRYEKGLHFKKDYYFLKDITICKN